MNRKLRVMILTVVLTVLMFGGNRLLAESVENKPVESQQTAPTEENLEPKPNGDEGTPLETEKNNAASSEETELAQDNNTDNSQEATADEEKNVPAQAQEATEEKTTEENANADAKPAAKEAEKPAETPDVKAAEKTAAGNGPEDGAKLQAAPAKAPEAQGTPVGEGNGTGTGEDVDNGEPTKPVVEKDQIDKSADEELKTLQDQIDAAKKAKDDKKAAELQKQYNEKYFEALEKSGAEKLDDAILDRFTDKYRTKEYYALKDEYQKLQAKAKEGKLTQKELDAFNEKLGTFDPPRILDNDEKAAYDKLSATPYIPGIADNSKEDAKKLFKAYKDAKEALEKALNPENHRTTDDEGLKTLVDNFNKAEAALKKAIEDGDVNPKYTSGKPEISIYPLDGTGKAGKELDKDTYYIPDATDFKLLFQVNKDKEAEGSTTKFRFTIKNLKNVGEVSVPEASLSNLVFLNKTAVHLQKDEKTGEYYFETTADQNFGIAQLKFNMPGFRAAFHEGFELTLEGTDAKKVTKKFLITKKGYEDYTDLDGIGSHNKDNPQKDVDAGDTQDAIVDGNTDKIFDFFTMLKKSDAYIDKVLVNSANGESLPLSSVDITITAPKNFDDNFADFIHKSGLNYHYLGNGKYQLKLDLQKFNKDKKFTVDQDGTLKYEEKAIDKATLTNVILESKDGKNYIDGERTENKVTTTTVLKGTLDSVEYQVRLSDDKHQVKSLWKKNDDGSYTKVGDFRDGKVTTAEKTFKLVGTELISYTSEKDVYEGNVSNKTEKDKNGAEKTEADPTVTPTFEGKQVTVETKETDSKGITTTKTSYGGTIVNDKFFQKLGENEYKYLIDQTDLTFAYIDDNGKMYTSQNADGTLKQVVFKKVTKDGKVGYYIVDGLEYEEGLTLIDKFGRLMKDITVTEKDGKYTFTHTKKKDKNDKDAIVTTETSKDGRTIHVDTSETSIFVNNKNYVENNKPKKFDSIIGKYYYDKEKKVFVLAKDDAKKQEKVIGDKFYTGFKSGSLEKKLIEIYTKEGKDYIVAEDTKRYYGSINKDDYYKHNNRIYVKKGEGENTYLMSADGGKANVIAPFDIQKIKQTLVTGKDAKQVITDEKNIFDAVQNAKFAFRFPGFLAGENVIYNVHADVKATYMQPNLGHEGQFEEKSIFNGGAVNEVKTVDKYFTIKIKENKKAKFFKDAPKEFKNIPDYNFFNIFYRDSDYTQRDQLLKPLLESKAEYDGKSEEEKKNVDEATKKQLEILDKIQTELKNRFDGAQFVLNGTTVEIQKDGTKVELDRSLLWELGFNNEDGVLFPEDRDTSIVVEDYNMDNRLVYDEIIINDTVKKWNQAKKAWEEKEVNTGKKFEKEFGTDEYFFLDQLDNIRLGVSRGYVDGAFIAVGPDFKITRKQIEDALGYNTEDVTDDKTEAELTLGLKDKKFKVKLTRDTDKGQIRIKVIKAFYKKNTDYSETDTDKNNKFSSPVQEAYKDQLEKFKTDANEKLTNVDTKEAFKTSFGEFIEKTYDKWTDCYGTLTHMFNELLEKVETEGKKPEEIKKALNDIKDKMVEEMGKMGLAYLDESKGNYKFDDMRFNAIRVELKPNITIGGAMTPQRTKKFGITSVIVPDVDIPYTDEFGKPMTNKDMYLNKFIKEILSDKKFGEKGIKDEKFKPEGWDKKEESYVKVMEEAYRRLNADKTINTVPLVTVSDEKDKYAWEKYTIKNGNEFEKELGKELAKNVLAIDGKPLENKKGGVINPWYILTEKDGIKSLEELAGSADEDTKAAIAKFKEKEIDLIGYYMLEQGYNRAFFKNFAQYKLPKQEQGPGIFGEENNWKHKLCYPGPIGQCIESAGGDKKPGADGDKDKDEAGFKNNAKFTIDYPSTDDTPKEEHPKTDKTSDKTDAVDISEKDQKIKFTIYVSVNQMTKTDKDLYDIKQGKTPSTKPEDYENGHYKYKKDTLIMDILPNIFKLVNGTKLNLTVYADALKKGGANTKIFADENAVNNWKARVEYMHVEDLGAYLKTLSGDRKEVLQKAYDEAVKEGRIKKGEKVQAVLAWLPEFEAPSGSTNHFKFELKDVLVDKTEFKDYLENGHGETYTNHAAFGDKGQVYFGKTDITIKKDKSGTVDKFLRIYDKDGNPVNKGNEKEWFEGNVELKFGDKFDYKLRYNNHIPTQETGRTGVMVSEFNIADQFAGIEKGLRPVLNGFVQVQEGYDGKYNIKYIINGTDYTKEQIEQQGLKLKDVTKITIETKTDRLGSGDHRDFILPMMVPELDAKIEDGKVVYIGKDGEKHELGKAEDFFDLKKLIKPGKDNEMSFDNKAEDSNIVTVYLDKERFIRVFKEFLAANGEKLKNLDNLEAKFDVYQIIEENGKKTRVKLDKQLIVNKANDFTDMLDHLPNFKKTTTIEKDGTVKVNEVKYEYELEEAQMPGFESKVYKLDDTEGLGFVWKATNTEKPEYPGDHPHDNPKNVKIKISVNKVWKVLNGGATPSIQVELYANGKATGKVLTLGANGSWSASFEDLPAKDADGKDIVYTVREVGETKGITKIGEREFEVEYAGSIEEGFTIRNNEVPHEEPHEDPHEEPHEDPHENPHEDPHDDNIIPKTGVSEDLSSIYFAFVLLLALVFIKRKYLAD